MGVCICIWDLREKGRGPQCLLFSKLEVAAVVLDILEGLLPSLLFVSSKVLNSTQTPARMPGAYLLM